MLVTLSVRVCYVPVLGSTVELEHDLRCSGQPKLVHYNMVWSPERIVSFENHHITPYQKRGARRPNGPRMQGPGITQGATAHDIEQTLRVIVPTYH